MLPYIHYKALITRILLIVNPLKESIMQNLLTLFGLLILGVNLLKANDLTGLNGVYYSPDHRLEILVQATRYHLKIKGLNNSRNWQRFRKVDRNSWRDSHGNLIVLGRRSQLILHTDKRRLSRKRNIIHFYKSRVRNFSGQEEYYPGRRRGEDYPSSYGYGKSEIFGSWYSKDFKLEMYIEPTRDGLRCRLQNEKEWTEYKKSKNRERDWEDRNGNKLIQDTDESIYWQSNNGLRKIRLTRSSD